eukprot:CAMPEP_0177760004 /NCGR_PEP_ID=MMETSP0491_2-20121128/5032_1 /TAXON_ID=63592 /ORGANISM="Tetraselmis chuii, Strain PLY429" /LENGTH=41 /DNA_ID= /DNA_START= /DNA_END= /DNA_ORIENTATION=
MPCPSCDCHLRIRLRGATLGCAAGQGRFAASEGFATCAIGR